MFRDLEWLRLGGLGFRGVVGVQGVSLGFHSCSLRAQENDRPCFMVGVDVTPGAPKRIELTVQGLRFRVGTLSDQPEPTTLNTRITLPLKDTD